MKQIYLGMSADVIESKHISMINEATKLGEVTIGLISDELMLKQNKVASSNYDQRKTMIENIKGVKNIIAQHSWDFSDHLKQIKPAYVAHSDECYVGTQSKIRARVINVIKEWGGEWLEFGKLHKDRIAPVANDKSMTGITPDTRRKLLRKLIDTQPIVRVLEVHNGLTGLIVENLRFNNNEGQIRQFDAMWSSSLTDSVSKGKPDIEIVDLSSRLVTVNEIFDVTTKPLIFDGDTGGKLEHFVYTVKSLERHGISAVIIEDKIGLKKNSLFGNNVVQTQETSEKFCEKIRAGKGSQVTSDFMIIARIESLILDKGMQDALRRAEDYIEAGADAIMIHSRRKEPGEILQFCKQFKIFSNQVPLVVVPTSYNEVTEDELIDAGVKVVIYANHLLRSAYPSMVKTAESILRHARSAECENACMSINEILELIPGTK